MAIKQRTIQIYEFEDLSPRAKDRAIESFSWDDDVLHGKAAIKRFVKRWGFSEFQLTYDDIVEILYFAGYEYDKNGNRLVLPKGK